MIQEILIQLGIMPGTKGFNYIIEFINELAINENQGAMIIYKKIAKKYGTKYYNVERCIRHAIQKCDKESEAWSKYIKIENVKNKSFLYILHFVKKGEQWNQ